MSRIRRGAVVLSLVTSAIIVSTGVAFALDGNATPTVDASPGAVAVVASSAPVKGKIAFVVANGSEQSVRIVRVTALASQTGGAQVLQASTTAVAPLVLAPGEQAIGQVTFRARTLAADASITWRVSARPVTSTTDPSRLAVGNLVLSPPKSGAVAQTLTLDATNSSAKTIKGPLTAQVVCLNEAGRPAVAASTAVERANVRAGATVPLTVKFTELCPSYVVAARGTPDR
jgi:hypothetical protein